MSLRLHHLQQREEHWAIVDLVGKGGHVRTVPMPDWVRNELNDWLLAAAIDRGKLFRRVNKVGRAWGEGITEKAVWHIVKESAKTVGIAQLAPHDLRRTFITNAEASDISPMALKALVNHQLPESDVTAGYVQMTVDRLREPTQRVCDRLLSLCMVPVVSDDVARLG